MTLWRVAAVCPGCGRVPTLRLSERAIRDSLHAEPDELYGTIQCHRRDCRTIYPLAYIALQRAESVQEDAA